MRPAVEAVIGNHLQTRTPVIIEGDYLLPVSAGQPAFAGTAAGGQVQAVFLHGPDVDQLMRNYRAREPDTGLQRDRAVVGVRYSHWLAEQATALGVPVVLARPRTTPPTRLQTLLTP